MILGIFIASPIGSIAAALVAVVTFIGTSSYGFYKADKNNPTTIEFDTPEFGTESENAFSFRITQRFNDLKGFFAKKSSTVALSPEVSTPVSLLFSLRQKSDAPIAEGYLLGVHNSFRS